MHTHHGNSADRGLIFDIQGHSVHDGPGTRTTVFLNGCPLRCTWCCNPEGLFNRPVVMYRQSKCKCCGDCLAACPTGSVRVVAGRLVFDRAVCDTCQSHACVKACLNEAVVESGKYYPIEEVLRILKRDRQFWGRNGGVSFSGGEPLLQQAFIGNLLRQCKKLEMHTCVETTSCLPTDYYLDVLRSVDWVFTDIKHMDPAIHKELTGRDNALILHNIEQLAKADWDGVIMPRVPVIPGRNDSEENLMATVDFIKGLGLDAVNILPFHRLGESKYRQLGQEYGLADQTSPSDEAMYRLKDMVQSRDVICLVGWETPF
ncbi:MAG: glycyl-radical enzyme activating protein [Solidesulfovibrio sp. DCME]|uniref:glycyl-radical enzyme activating protein n=1 Tax=Solidesulfovibrio sp. DCME TaxID=3447380 RepID=UPI003D09F723